MRSKCTRAGFSCLWGGNAAFELAGREHLAALVVVGLGFVVGSVPPAGGFLLGDQPWCDVPAATSTANPAGVCAERSHAPALAVSGEEAQYSSVLRAHRAMLVAVYLDPINSAVPTKGFSPSARGHGAT